MKPCNDNNGATIHAGRAATVHNPFCYALMHTTVEYLNRNVSMGQLGQRTSKSIVICARSSQKC